jgi:hypothetical protein
LYESHDMWDPDPFVKYEITRVSPFKIVNVGKIIVFLALIIFLTILTLGVSKFIVKLMNDIGDKFNLVFSNFIYWIYFLVLKDRLNTSFDFSILTKIPDLPFEFFKF